MLQIIIVDDAAEDRTLAHRVLKQCKITNPIHLIKNGMDCIATLRAGAARSTRFLVLLDLAMAPHNGQWVLREAAQRGLMSSAIFVMMSGIAGIKDVHEGYQLGAKTFFIKPLQAQDIRELLDALRARIGVD